MSLIASFFLAYSITSATVCLFVKAVPLIVPWRLSQEVSTFSIVIVLPTNLVQSLVPLDRPSKFTRATGRVSWFLDDKVKTVSMTYFILLDLFFVKWLTFRALSRNGLCLTGVTARRARIEAHDRRVEAKSKMVKLYATPRKTLPSSVLIFDW